MIRFTPFLSLICSCAYVTAASPLSSSAKKMNFDPLPPDPETESIPGDITNYDWVESLETGRCIEEDGKPTKEASIPCPDKSGIFISEARAARDVLYRIRYKELRLNYQADMKAWATQQALLEDRLKEALDYVNKTQPNWFERHAFEVGVLSGAVLGIGMTVGVVYGVKAALE